jgi:2-polyprenyl-3-methyl-5-hydroxy-6-metoxy-1,4-benzoquinol methylase
MSSFWDRIYQTDISFFGEKPSNFALSCYNEYMKKKNHVKKILELGCGQGRDTLFFASKGIDVTALDFSSIAIKGLIKHAKERSLTFMHLFLIPELSQFHLAKTNSMPYTHICFSICTLHGNN